MSTQLDPKKALYLKPSQRTLPCKTPGKKRSRPQSKRAWQRHNGNYAIDPWGVAIRTLRERGINVEAL